MKNLIKWLGIITLAAVIGFTFAACGDDGGGGGADPVNGTWDSGSGDKLVLSNGAFTLSGDDVEIVKGTYSASGNNITMTVTQLKGAVFEEDASDMGLSVSQWYTQEQLRTAIINHFVGLGITRSEAEALYNQQAQAISAMYGTGTGTLNGNTLTITMFGETSVLTKQGGSNPNPGVGGSSASTFILTGIPSEYNGKYASVPSASVMEDDNVSGYQDNELSGVLISNGTVSIPMWILRDDNAIVRWYGNRTAEVVYFAIYDSAVTTGSALLRLRFNSVTFSNGGTNKTWSDGRVY